MSATHAVGVAAAASFAPFALSLRLQAQVHAAMHSHPFIDFVARSIAGIEALRIN